MLIKNGPSSGFPSPGLFTQLRGVYLSGQMLQFPAVGMKLGSIFLSLVLGQTLGIRKARYKLHKLLSAAGDAQGVQKQQQCQELSFPLFLLLIPTPVCLSRVPLQPCSAAAFPCPWVMLSCPTPNSGVCLC